MRHCLTCEIHQGHGHLRLERPAYFPTLPKLGVSGETETKGDGSAFAWATCGSIVATTF